MDKLETIVHAVPLTDALKSLLRTMFQYFNNKLIFYFSYFNVWTGNAIFQFIFGYISFFTIRILFQLTIARQNGEEIFDQWTSKNNTKRTLVLINYTKLWLLSTHKIYDYVLIGLDHHDGLIPS